MTAYGKVSKTCRKCGKRFLQRKSGKGYCSRSCAMTAFYDAHGRKATKSYQGICEVCGRTFLKRYSYKHHRSCSVRCAGILRGRANTGNLRGTIGRVAKKGKYLRQFAPDHPHRDKDGYVAHHRLVVEKEIGRLLEPHEKVHHRNGVKTDNRPENLQIVTLARPNGEVTCPYCRREFELH